MCCYKLLLYFSPFCCVWKRCTYLTLLPPSLVSSTENVHRDVQAEQDCQGVGPSVASVAQLIRRRRPKSSGKNGRRFAILNLIDWNPLLDSNLKTHGTRFGMRLTSLLWLSPSYLSSGRECCIASSIHAFFHHQQTSGGISGYHSRTVQHCSSQESFCFFPLSEL